MDVRRADTADRPAIRDVARRSLQASYSLEPRAIITAVEEWYDEDRLAQTMEDDERALLVAEWDGQLVAFSESTLAGDVGTILWLHVDPAHRGRGIGTDLFETTREHLAADGAETLQGRVLADNEVGNAFYEAQGFTEAGEEEVDIAGRTYVEQRYVEAGTEGREEMAVDDQTVFLDRDATEDGSVGPFNVVFTDEDGEDPYGYYCANCGTVANAMDAMGRIECDECGNVRKPRRWDAAYL